MNWNEYKEVEFWLSNQIGFPSDATRPWVKSESKGVCFCRIHDTIFNLDEQPCWQCWNEAGGD